MNHPHLLTIAFASPLLLASCSVPSDEYDTPPPYSAPVAPTNPIYDNPAAYEDGVPGNPAQADPGLPADPSAPTMAQATAPAIPTAPANPVIPAPSTRTEAIVHTVVAGDTLSGISAKYKVPAASIRSANNMTGDTVVLGRKMIIPAR